MSSAVASATESSVSASISAASASASHAGLVDPEANKAFKIVGISLAIGSGLFIGASFVIKKKGLLSATRKHGNAAGDGHAYLKNWIWWTGMIMMVIGEILNFVAYAFTEAILVTPMGALSVVVCAILSHFFLQESLTFFGWIGCVLCILGATILALNAPEQQSVTTIVRFRQLFIAPGFLVWMSLCIVASLVLVFYAVPRWGKTNMMPHISICSLIGGISVSCTQGLGSSIVTSIQGNNQVKNWFFWFLAVFVVVTLLIEINYLNKALELFNTSMVVPVYFCYFSTATLITSFILYQGLKASAVTLITMVLGFLVICLGITLLQLSKVDPKQLGTKLDRKSTMLFEANKHQTEDAEKGQVTAIEDPGMDALRGGFGAVGSIIRARSVSRKLSMAGNSGMGSRFDSQDLSTHGLANVQRYSLTDTPMKSPILDNGHAGPSRSGSLVSSFFPSRSKSQIKFEEADVVHQYGYGKDDDAYHHYRQHPHSAPPLSHTLSQSKSVPSIVTTRQPSTGSTYPPVMEEPEDDEDLGGGYRSNRLPAADREKSYLDPYSQASGKYTYQSDNVPSSGILDQQGRRPSRSGGGTLSNLFSFSQSADPSKQTSSHGKRDHPHISRRDYALEHEEREALVSPIMYADEKFENDRHSDEGRESYEEPRSAVTDESVGHVFKAERRAAPSTTPGFYNYPMDDQRSRGLEGGSESLPSPPDTPTNTNRIPSGPRAPRGPPK